MVAHNVYVPVASTFLADACLSEIAVFIPLPSTVCTLHGVQLSVCTFYTQVLLIFAVLTGFRMYMYEAILPDF